MSEFTGLSSGDLDKKLRDAEQRAIRVRELNERVAELVGEGEAANGDVWVSWVAGEGLSEVQIDPQAMRLSADELGAAVKAAVRDALADLREQVQEVMAEVLGEDHSTGPQAARDRLEAARQVFDSRMSQVMGELERMRRARSPR